jgi:1-pyrroline-5-carboxylate dehydrogenase
MLKGFFNVPTPVNEPILAYAPGSKERELLKAALADARSKVIEIPMYIGGKEVFTESKGQVTPPHDHQHVLANFSKGDKNHVSQAIDAALAAKADWENLAWEHRAAIFLKAADLIAGPYRYKLNAATMLGQSKNAYQAEIDSACELIDFLRFNVNYMSEIYQQQPPVSPRGSWNRVEQRPLEGFCFCANAIQLYRYCRKPANFGSNDGKCSSLETSEHPDFCSKRIDADFPRSGIARRCHQLGLCFWSGCRRCDFRSP